MEGKNWIENFVPIPIARGEISAGSPREVEENPDGIAIIYKSWAPNHKDFTIVRVKGESMEPLIPDGSLVGIDHSQRDIKLLNNKIVAFRKRNEATIKRLRLIAPNIIIAEPENKDFLKETIVIKGKEINEAIIGKVVWWLSKQK